MNKTAIKIFSIWARRKLIDDITYQAGLIGVSEKGIAEPLPQSTVDMHFFDIGTKNVAQLAGAEKIRKRNQLISEIKRREKGADYKRGFDSVVEEIAYTWFNRMIAIRFMEVNDYLPSRIRVLSSEQDGKNEPDIVTTPFETDIEFSDTERDEIIRLKEENKIDELFFMLFIKQCDQLNAVLPGLFDKTSKYKELLLALSITDVDGVIYHLVHDIDEEDWKDQVQIIGWIYQFYNSELKDETFALLKKNVKVTKERIPSATQLFTPDWIVRYMIENSLGRFFVEKRKTQGIYADGRSEEEMTHEEIEKNRIATEEQIAKEMGWKYFLPEAEQTKEVDAELRKIRAEYAGLKPEELTFIDPCMGSGHILAYAFDVLMQIYLANGYEERDAAQSILQHNLYGLDIDERAYQLSYFALMMKAMAYDKRILFRGIRPHVYAIEESNDIDRGLLTQFGASLEKMEREGALKQMTAVLDVMHDAKEYGSAIKVEAQDWELLRRFVEDAETKGQMKIGIEHLEATQEKLRLLLEIAEVLAGKYWTVCTNPPYMGSKGMGALLAKYVQKHYPESKYDLFSVFIECCMTITMKNGIQAMITQHAWMFLSSYEKLRSKLMLKNIINMAHLGAKAFDEIGGEVVQTTSFILRNGNNRNYKGLYCRLIDPTSQVGKETMFLSKENRYCANQDDFEKVPGKTVGYWITDTILDSFDPDIAASKLADFRHGMSTSDNNTYLRLWFEPESNNIGFTCESKEQTKDKKWYIYLKGGTFRRWYGNFDYVVNWKDDGREIKEISNIKYPYLKGNLDFVLGGQMYFFKPGYTWSSLTSGKLGIRKFGIGCIFDAKGQCFFPYNDEDGDILFAFYNSVVFEKYGEVLSPTLDFNSGVISKAPIKRNNRFSYSIKTVVHNNVLLSKADWDSYEISWDYARHPLITYADDIEIDHPATEYDSNGHQSWTYESERASLLSEAYENWKEVAEERFTTLKANEEELNRIFIDLYGLQEELTPEIADKDITVHRIYDTKEDVPESMNGSAHIRLKSDEIKSLLSYAVGCMFGRYSLNRNGLVYAGGDFDKVYWKHKGQAALDENGELPFGAGYAGVNMAAYCYPRFRDAAAWEDATVLSFWPDADNVILICDEAYFGDDVAGRFCEFLSVAYGKKTLEDNLQFVSDALGGKGSTPREVIRNYFLNDFFKDHTKTYQKRPIYWLFDSGKQDGFKCLVYMHRWNADTVGNVRVNYLHKAQRVYEREIQRMQELIDSPSNARESTRARKRMDKLQKQLKETRDYDEKLAHIALSRIDIDLDDGVKVNYEKVQTDREGNKYQILAKI